jgi:hypothetical protein
MAWFFKKTKNYISTLDTLMRQHRKKNPMTEDQLREQKRCQSAIDRVKEAKPD